MTTVNDIFSLYEEYLSKAEKLERERKPGDGLLGMGKKPADDPCHDEFADSLEQALDAFAETHPSADDVHKLLSYIYSVPAAHKDMLSIYWMLCAVQGLTLSLIPLLTPQAAKEIRSVYSDDFPRWERLPVQKQVWSALGKVK